MEKPDHASDTPCTHRIEVDMKLARLALLVAICFEISLSGWAQIENRNRGAHVLAEFSDSLRDLSTRVSPAVVQVTGTGYGLYEDEHHTAGFLSRQQSTGSGIIVAADGYIITNAHVIQDATSIRVKLNQRRSQENSLFDAKLIGKDSDLDLALLKIQAEGLKPIEFGNSEDLKQGELVMAFGSPLGMNKDRKS